MGGAGSDRLPDRALGYLNARACLEAVATAVVLTVVAVVGLDEAWRWGVLAAGAVLILLGLVLEVRWLNPLRMRTLSYTVGPRFIYVVRGVLLRRSTTVATHQVLNVESVQGPLLARFDLEKLRFRLLADTLELGPLHESTVVDVRRAVALLREDAVGGT